MALSGAMIMLDPLDAVLIAAAAFGALMVLRFVAAMWLDPSHPVNRAAETVERPLWAAKPAQHPTDADTGHTGDGGGC